MPSRDAVLAGTQAADRLHLKLGTRGAIESGGRSRIDIFGAVAQLGAVLLFRRLSGLLGAYLSRPVVDSPGIIVSTERNLHVQRFTAAHELGHFIMQHEPSLDEQIGLWRVRSSSPHEVAADAFASQFLLPRWLYVHHARRQAWRAVDFETPSVVYQLSLRLGASYEATCWGLRGHRIVSPAVFDRLRRSEPKALKQETLGGRAELTNSWADVWVITPADDGLTFEGGPDDVVIFRFPERASAGYLWDESQLLRQGFALLTDDREEPFRECGAEVCRVLVAKVSSPREYKISLIERRPWRPEDSIGSLSVSFDLHGKEHGLPRAARKSIAAA